MTAISFYTNFSIREAHNIITFKLSSRKFTKYGPGYFKTLVLSNVFNKITLILEDI